MLESVEQLIAPDGDTSKIGSLSPEDYKTVSGMLKENGLIDTFTEFNSFYVPAGKYVEE
jgi:hypothetical protein